MSSQDQHPDRTTLRSLKGLDDLPATALEELQQKLRVSELPAGRQLFVRGRSDHHRFYLLSGTVLLEYDDGATVTVAGGSAAAKAPLAEEQPRRATATATTTVRFLRVDRDLLEVLAGAGEGGPIGLEEIAEDDSEADNRLFHALYHDYMADALELPHLPDVAVRVREAAQDEDADAATIARIIQTDPVLTAKLIQAANSPLYGVQTPITTCRAAVLFLGLETTRNLVLTYTLRELFKTDSALLRQRMTDLWQHSALVASVSYLLAGSTPSMERERGMLAGLLHDVGTLPIIHYAGRYPELADDPAHLERTIAGLRGQIGAMLLRHWRFGDEMVQVALECEQWQRDPERTAQLTDLVLVAQLIAGDPDREDRPEPTAVPAAAKLARGRLDEGLCDQLLQEARDDVANTLGLFA